MIYVLLYSSSNFENKIKSTNQSINDVNNF